MTRAFTRFAQLAVVPSTKYDYSLTLRRSASAAPATLKICQAELMTTMRRSRPNRRLMWMDSMIDSQFSEYLLTIVGDHGQVDSEELILNARTGATGLEGAVFIEGVHKSAQQSCPPPFLTRARMRYRRPRS